MPASRDFAGSNCVRSSSPSPARPFAGRPAPSPACPPLARSHRGDLVLFHSFHFSLLFSLSLLLGRLLVLSFWFLSFLFLRVFSFFFPFSPSRLFACSIYLAPRFLHSHFLFPIFSLILSICPSFPSLLPSFPFTPSFSPYPPPVISSLLM